MAKTGAKFIMWAPFKAADKVDAAPTYDTPVTLSELAAANWTPSTASGEQYGDNKKVESAAMVTGGTLGLEVTDLSTDTRAKIHGETVDTPNSLYKAGSEDVAPFGGVVYYKTGVRNSVGYFEGYFYPKCKASPASDSATTANSTITFNNDTLSLSVFPRLNDNTYREVSERFDNEADCIAWCKERFGVVA